jgi:hypothetical protein
MRGNVARPGPWDKIVARPAQPPQVDLRKAPSQPVRRVEPVDGIPAQRVLRTRLRVRRVSRSAVGAACAVRCARRTAQRRVARRCAWSANRSSGGAHGRACPAGGRRAEHPADVSGRPRRRCAQPTGHQCPRGHRSTLRAGRRGACPRDDRSPPNHGQDAARVTASGVPVGPDGPLSCFPPRPSHPPVSSAPDARVAPPATSRTRLRTGHGAAGPSRSTPASDGPRASRFAASAFRYQWRAPLPE